MNQIKSLWGHYLALLLLLILLVIPITCFYHYFRNHFGTEISIVLLALIIIGVLILVVRGAVYTSQIHRAIRQQVDASNLTPITTEAERPMMFKVFDMDLRPCEIVTPIAETDMNTVHQEIQKLLDSPKKRRGKQARFPVSQIRKAVLMWEQRDPSFSAMTLDEFLEERFGCGPDGILLMAPTTFYDWRRRILKELEGHRTPGPRVGLSSEHPLSEQPSQRPESIS